MWLHLQLKDEKVGILNVYGPQTNRARKTLWRLLCQELDGSLRWFGGGDWNFIEGFRDKLGGVPKNWTKVPLEWHEFQDLAMDWSDPWVECPARQLLESLKYSWTNGAKDREKLKASRLDRIYIPNE